MQVQGLVVVVLVLVTGNVSVEAAAGFCSGAVLAVAVTERMRARVRESGQRAEQTSQALPLARGQLL